MPTPSLSELIDLLKAKIPGVVNSAPANKKMTAEELVALGNTLEAQRATNAAQATTNAAILARLVALEAGGGGETGPVTTTLTDAHFLDSAPGVTEGNHVYRNEYASTKPFTTTASTLSIAGTNTMSAANALTTTLVYVGTSLNTATLHHAFSFANTGELQTVECPPLPAGTKVGYVVSGQSEYVGGQRKGNFLHALITDAPLSFAAVGPPRVRVIGVVDSIGSGDNSPNPGATGLPGRLRLGFPDDWRFTAEGGSGASLYDDVSTSGAADAFVAHLGTLRDGTELNILYLQRSINDAARYAVDLFMVYSPRFLDKYHAAYPNDPIVWSTATATTATGFAGPAPAFRETIEGFAADRAYLTAVDGLALVSTENVDTDKLHLLAVGQAEFATNLLPYLLAALPSNYYELSDASTTSTTGSWTEISNAPTSGTGEYDSGGHAQANFQIPGTRTYTVNMAVPGKVEGFGSAYPSLPQAYDLNKDGVFNQSVVVAYDPDFGDGVAEPPRKRWEMAMPAGIHTFTFVAGTPWCIADAIRITGGVLVLP